MKKRDVVSLLEGIADQLPVATNLSAPFVAGPAIGGEWVSLNPTGPFAKVLAQALLRVQVDKDEPLPGVESNRRQTEAFLVKIEKILLVGNRQNLTVEPI